MNLFDKFLQVADRLENEGVDYILIGGFAVILYGMPRLTQDVDLFIKNDEDNVHRLKTVLYDIFQDATISEITVEELAQYPVIRYGSPDGFYIDLIVKIGETFTYTDIDFEIMEVEGHKIKIATVESLLRLKENTVRPIDKNDAFFLQELMKRKETF
jgi:predicted nucleotidyltransferase